MIKTYTHQKVSLKDLRAAAKWFKARLNLRDWTVTLYTKNNPPACFGNDLPNDAAGACLVIPEFKVCRIWINMPDSKKDGTNVLQMLAHEFLHLLQESVGVEDYEVGGLSTQDRMCYTLDSVLYEAYCKDIGKRVAQIFKSLAS